AEKPGDARPVGVGRGREQLIARACGVAARQRDRPRRLLGDELRERRRHVRNNAHLTAQRHERQDTPVDEKTIEVYEAEAERWRDTRPARFSDRAEAMGAALPPGAVRADLGCG